jgi:hypothetical protein
MSSQPALSEAAAPRMLVVADGPHETTHEVFDVVGGLGDVADGAGMVVVRVRTPFLFEIGEELAVRIEQDGTVCDAVARVRGHVGPDESRITELEVAERTEPRRVVSG